MRVVVDECHEVALSEKLGRPPSPRLLWVFEKRARAHAHATHAHEHRHTEAEAEAEAADRSKPLRRELPTLISRS